MGGLFNRDIKNIPPPHVLPKHRLPAAAGGGEGNLLPAPLPSGRELLVGPWPPQELQGRQALRLRPGNGHLLIDDSGNHPGPLPTRGPPARSPRSPSRGPEPGRRADTAPAQQV